MIPEWLRIFGDARMAIYALVVIFIVIFMPKGILFYATQLFKLGAPSPFPSPPQPGERAGARGKDKTGNSYTMNVGKRTDGR